MEGISIDYRYEQTVEDLVQSAMQAVEANKSLRRGTMITYGICAFLFGFILFASFTEYGISLAALLCGAASCGVFLLAFPWVLRRNLKKRAKTLVKENSRTLLEQRGFSLTQKGLRLWGGSFDKIYPYKTINSIVEQKEYLAISFEKEGDVSLPLRAFEDDSQRQDFLRQLRELAAQTDQ